MIDRQLDINQIVNNQKLRKELAMNSLYWFFHIYLHDYVHFPTAKFQKEIISIAEDQDLKNAFIVAFRGSAKSTLATLALPLWSIIGKHKKKFIVIISQTQPQAKLILSNIRGEIEHNELFIKDFGHLSTDSTNSEWNSGTIVIGKSGIRISVYSTGESIRGIRNLSSRPDLIIGDDLEDLAAVKNRDTRDQTFNWFTGEIMPLGDPKTKLIVIGNLLHEDSLMMKIKNAIYSDSLSGKFYEYPLISSDGDIAWPGKYPTQKEITEERKKIGNNIAWYREYLLQILPPEDRIIHHEWIKFYDQLPLNIQANLVNYVISVDPAISEKDTADKTAILVGAIYKSKNFHYLYITDIYNLQINFPTTKELIERLSSTVDPRHKTIILVEQVGYQEALIQALKTEGYPVEGINPHGRDKRARLSVASSYVKNRNVFFPKNRSSELVDQLINFGVEKNDDLADAFTMMVNEIFGKNNNRLNSQGPTTIKVIGPSIYGRNSDEDWADAEDKRMLTRINPRAKWSRVIG